MPACPAGYDFDALEFAKLVFGDVHLIEENFPCVQRNAAQHGVAYRARLLKDFLLHEMLEAALFGHDGVPGDVLNRTLDGVPIEVEQADAIGREDGDVAVGEENDVARVMKDGWNIAGDEELLLPKADDGRRSETGSYDFLRVASGKDSEGEDSAELLDGFLHGIFERATIVVRLDKMGDDLGIGLSLEFVALRGELMLQLQVIFNYAVVDDDDFAGAIAVRMRVFFRRAAVSVPAREADAVHTFERRKTDSLLEISKLAGGAANFQVAILADHGDSRRLLAAIFEPFQAVDHQRNNFFRADVTNYPAHDFRFSRCMSKCTCVQSE